MEGKLYSLSILSGFSCPFAKICLAKATLKPDGHYTVVQGKHAELMCFSARQEVVFPSVRRQREHNFSLLRKFKHAQDMAKLIFESMPKDATIIRIHVGGDFYSKEYMKAWFMVAKQLPNILFYAYTKSIGYWVELLNEVPSNFKMNGSIGGTQDHLLKEHNLKSVHIVYSEKEAKQKRLKIDHTDELAYKQDKPFALLLHGVQPKGTKAAAARLKLQKADIGQYSREKIKQQMKLKKAA